jgi:succinate dehydrogenase/fumarate reductase flavoprotein subunit
MEVTGESLNRSIGKGNNAPALFKEGVSDEHIYKSRSNTREKQIMMNRRRFFRNAAIAGVGITAGNLKTIASPSTPSHKWDQEADVIVIGAGATGLPAAIEARELGASVLLVEANYDVGGHAILSVANIPLGGGNSHQKKFGIVDSPDQLFSDLTDWKVVQSNGFPNYRYNDKEVIRAYADNAADSFEWLLAHGVTFVDEPPDGNGGFSVGGSVPREAHAAALDWPLVQTGKPVAPTLRAKTSSGVGLIRPLEIAARKLGIPILLEHKMTSILREHNTSGRVIGITADNKGKTLKLHAKKGVIVATGGSSGNVNFRRIFDPRLTEEYNGSAGEPWTFQDASGEIAALAVGASIWGAYNQVGEFDMNVTKAAQIGTEYRYGSLQWLPGSPIFSKARASGLRVRDWQNLILVNQIGKRFYDETAGRSNGTSYPSSGSQNSGIIDYVPSSRPKNGKAEYDAHQRDFLNAILAGTGQSVNGGGPIWAIFDADAVKREKWIPKPPNVDIESGYFFEADSLAELASKIVNKFQTKNIPAQVLLDTIDRYNSFVETGIDSDFAKPKPLYKIQTPPFYAAYAVPAIHDCRTGLRINAHSQVVDLKGEVIPGLYSGGESAGGFSLHGLARAIVQGRIAAKHAASA